ncbi:terminase [Escherichia coli]|nr:terminase [Escherichia coli]
MEVNKKQLADIFGASIRTIQNWQEQGMPVLRGGGKGNEVLYDSAAVIKWYAERDAEIENEKLRREVEELRQASETDLQPGTIEYERHRLTRAQADAQELKNARDSAEVVETAFCTFVLSRIAGEIASILDGIPLSVQRRFPELENRHVDFLKRDIIKAMNKAAALDELIPGLLVNISNSQVNRLRHFVRAGLRSLFRPEPQTAVEWADANYYLPKESAYQEGRWETLPFQRAIMNAMGSDYIREVNVVKSARVGYSKMLLGVYAYFIEHKQRNTLIWLPTDGDAENFMKTHVEPTIRDIPSLLALAPWYGKKHRDNTLTMKRFSNGRGFWCLGGKAAKNYREKSVDVAGYDELAAFDEDIEQEGSPTFLGDKRIEGSVWPKSIRGSTPKVRGTCQIERAASESPHFMRFHVACPHCGEEQYLKFGDKETSFGLKWTPDDPSSVFYLCEHNACVIRQQELDFTDARYICEKTGIWTRDGILWFSSSGEEIEPPDSVTFHIWTAYSPFTTWVQIVKDWMKTKGDTGKRKTFVNTTLGETWEAKIGERPDAEVMAERKEHYSAPVPDRVAYLTAGIDSQLDRYEMRVWGWGPGEESWLIDRQIIMGRHDDEQTLLRVDEAINKTYTRRNGAEMSVSRICWDTGGIDPTIVYERSKKHGLFRVIPIKGASVYGKPVASMPRKRNKNGVYLTEIGTDTAKEQIYNRFTLTPEGDEPLPGAVHFPNNPDIFDLTEAQQLTAEEQVEKWVDGRKKILWDSKKRRNEALDCFVYALAALRISISRWQLDLSALLASLQEEDGAATNKKTLADYARALSGEDE